MAQSLWPEFQKDGFMLAVSALMGMMLFLIFSAYYLAKNKIRAIHETGVGLLLGILLSYFASKILSADNMKMLAFDSRFFFVYLLPPVIFNSGYAMQKRYFFANISAVATYAFLGTLISFSSTAVFMLGARQMGMHSWSPLECFLFGAVICATDTVGVVAIMEKAPVSRDLFSIVMGESVFNDAVAIVLHETCMHFVHEPVTRETLVSAVFFFIIVFMGSTIIGILFGVAATVLLKKVDMRKYPHIEFVILLMFAYASYFCCTGLSMSGVCSILFCGVAMSHYTVPNLSPEAERVTHHAFHPFSYLCETYVFLSLGLSAFAFPMKFSITAIFAALVSIIAARSLYVFGLGYFLNMFRHPIYKLSIADMSFLSFSGPRGAMAFALALSVHTAHSKEILAVTMIICIITILVLGATTYPVLGYLGLLGAVPAPAEHGHDGDAEHHEDDAGAGGVEMESADPEGGAGHGHGHGHGHGAAASEEPLDLSKMESWFNRLDRIYIKPLLIREDRLQEFAVEAPLLPRGMLDPQWADVDLSSLVAGSRTTSVAAKETASGPVINMDGDSLFWN